MKFHSPTDPNLNVPTPTGSAQFIDGTYETDDPEKIEELKAYFAVSTPVKPLRSEVEAAKAAEKPKAAAKPKTPAKKPAAKKAPAKAVKK